MSDVCEEVLEIRVKDKVRKLEWHSHKPCPECGFTTNIFRFRGDWMCRWCIHDKGAEFA